MTKQQEAAHKAWKTRRAKAKPAKSSRSEAARKARVTRKANGN